MIDVTVDRDMLAIYAPKLMSDVREYERDNHEEPTTDLAELFDRYLTWNGIVGYGSTLRSAIYELITCSQEHVTITDADDTDRLRKILGVR